MSQAEWRFDSFARCERLSPRLRLTGHLGVEMELTDSDVNTHEREPLLEDTTVTAAYSLGTLPGGLKGSVSLRLSLWGSYISSARLECRRDDVME